MYRIPDNLDLSPVVGEFTTQVQVGQFDLQFKFGSVRFAVQSPVNLFRDGKQVAHWEEGRWPDPGFYDIMNAEVKRCEVVHDRLIVIVFDNGIAMHLEGSSDQYECMKILRRRSVSVDNIEGPKSQRPLASADRPPVACQILGISLMFVAVFVYRKDDHD